MKRTKRGMALILAAVMLVSCVTTILIAASKSWNGAQLGDLSQYYETGNSADPGYISTVTGDSGGTSYGIYMFVESTVVSFMDWLKKSDKDVYKNFGETLYNAYAYNTKGDYYPGCGSNFKNHWRTIAESNRGEFAQAQTDYWEATQYTQLISNIKALFPAFDIDNYSIALKNVFWSRSVQHGVGATSGANSTDGKSGATGVIYRAFANRLGGFKNQSEAELIQAIYAECSKLDETNKDMTTQTAAKYGVSNRSMAYYSANSGGVQTAVYRRLHVNEPADALVMRYSNIDHNKAEGKYTLLRYSDQALGLQVSSDTAVVTDAAATVLTLTYYNSDKYTLTASDGSRLTDNGGKVTLATPAADNNQFWTIENDTLKNCGSGRYLSVDADKNVSAVSDSSSAETWRFASVSGKDGWTTVGLFYPGCADSDGQGHTVTHKLTEGNSSFPLRGIISHPCGVKSVTVKVDGSGGFTVSKDCSGTWFDLWELDESAKFSQLKQGEHTLTITATDGKGNTVELVSSPITVGAKESSSTTDGKDEKYTVTFVSNGKTLATKTYSLGETYGELPEVTAEGFQGWFLSDGTEITSNSIVAAENHTVTALFGDLHTVTFVSEGTTVKTLKLAEGSLITAPSTPVKAADSSYVYSFSYWQDANGNRFTAGSTYMGSSDITYTAVFAKSTNTGDNISGNYLTGITPGTSVSALTAKGYTVYDGSTKVTSGLLGTGMTASSSSASVTIVVTGDVSGDGKITITDVVKLQNSVVGANSLSGAYAKAADINGDGKITITDVVQAAQVTVGQRTIG